MRYVTHFTAVLVFACSTLLAQTSSEPTQQLGGLNAFVFSVSQYCGGLENFQRSQEPLLLASVAPDAFNAAEWRRYHTRAEWETAGHAVPAALAWMRHAKVVVAVRLAFHSEAEGINIADYCFREDGTLAKVELSLTPEQEWIRPGMYAKVKVVRSWFFGPAGNRIAEVQDWRPAPLKSERTDFIYGQPPLFHTVAQLPFIRLLYPGT